MIKNTPCNLRWFVLAVLFCLCFVQTTDSEVAPTANGIFNSIIQAVEDDDNAAYRAARMAALELEDREFDALLETLTKAETWQALAIEGGLRVRRNNPILAAEFDVHLDWLRNNPGPAKIGPIFYWRAENNMFASAEGDWMRFEAVLTEKADLPTDGRGVPGWIAFRRAVFDSGALYADDMRFRIMMLRDVPGWSPDILGGLPASIRRSSRKVDRYVPELVEHYMRIRQEVVNDTKVTVHIQPRPTISTFHRIMEAIAEAGADKALTALRQIREFELMTGADIESTLKDQGAKSWHNPRLEVLLGKLDELIEKHQEAANN